MKVTAKLKYLHISPRKVRLVTNLIKGMDVAEAELRLRLLPKRAAKPLLKLLASAVASAKHDFELEEKNLYISKIVTNPGPVLKRSRARARGRASLISRRTSHVILELTQKVPSTKTKIKKQPEDIIPEKAEPLAEEAKKPLPETTKTKAPEIMKRRITRKPKKKEFLGKLKLKRIGKKIFRRKSI